MWTEHDIADLTPEQIHAYVRHGQRLREEHMRLLCRRAFDGVGALLKRSSDSLHAAVHQR